MDAATQLVFLIVLLKMCFVYIWPVISSLILLEMFTAVVSRDPGCAYLILHYFPSANFTPTEDGLHVCCNEPNALGRVLQHFTDEAIAHSSEVHNLKAELKEKDRIIAKANRDLRLLEETVDLLSDQLRKQSTAERGSKRQMETRDDLELGTKRMRY
jgi:hypothetical protein